MTDLRFLFLDEVNFALGERNADASFVESVLDLLVHGEVDVPVVLQRIRLIG